MCVCWTGTGLRNIEAREHAAPTCVGHSDIHRVSCCVRWCCAVKRSNTGAGLSAWCRHECCSRASRFAVSDAGCDRSAGRRLHACRSLLDYAARDADRGHRWRHARPEQQCVGTCAQPDALAGRDAALAVGNAVRLSRSGIVCAHNLHRASDVRRPALPDDRVSGFFYHAIELARRCSSIVVRA